MQISMKELLFTLDVYYNLRLEPQIFDKSNLKFIFLSYVQ